MCLSAMPTRTQPWYIPNIAWLHDQGINIWYDEGISPGKNWRETIGKALLGASTFVVYLSRASLESDHCNREINLALDEGKEVIPVYLEPIELTADLKIGLNRLQALTADRSGKHRETLLDTIGQVPPTESTSVPHRRSSHRRASLLLIAAVFLILAAAGSWVVINDDNQQTQSLPALNLYERSFTTSDPTEKIELLEKALEYDPGFLDARAHLAYELLQVGESGLAPPLPAFRRARDEALEVLAMDPQHAMGTAALARTYLQLDLDANKALETFIRAESLGAHSSMSAIFKAAIYLNTGKYDKAENTMRAAHERYPDSVGVAEFYARCLYLSGNVQAAWSMFDKALQLNPREQNAVIFSLSMAMAEKDASRIRELTKVIPTDAMIRGLGEPQAAAAEGNFEPLREILSFYEANREELRDQRDSLHLWLLVDQRPTKSTFAGTRFANKSIRLSTSLISISRLNPAIGRNWKPGQFPSPIKPINANGCSASIETELNTSRQRWCFEVAGFRRFQAVQITTQSISAARHAAHRRLEQWRLAARPYR